MDEQGKHWNIFEAWHPATALPSVLLVAEDSAPSLGNPLRKTFYIARSTIRTSQPRGFSATYEIYDSKFTIKKRTTWNEFTWDDTVSPDLRKLKEVEPAPN